MNPDDRFLEAALAEPDVPITAGYVPPDRQPAPERPLRPVWGAIWQLPRWARVAFAARCARLVLPERQAGQPEGEGSQAVVTAEHTAARGEVGSEAADAALLAAQALSVPSAGSLAAYPSVFARHAGGVAVYHAVYAAHIAAHPAGNPNEIAEHAMGAAAIAARVFAEAQGRATETVRALASPGEELARLVRLAREQGWTDATPVPPTVFGPVWNVSPAAMETPDPDPAPAESGSK